MNEPTTKIETARGYCKTCDAITHKEVNRKKKALICKICKNETSLRG